MNTENAKQQSLQIPMKTPERRPSDWFRDSFGTIGKYGKISRDKWQRASTGVEVITTCLPYCETSICYGKCYLYILGI